MKLLYAIKYLEKATNQDSHKNKQWMVVSIRQILQQCSIHMYVCII